MLFLVRSAAGCLTPPTLAPAGRVGADDDAGRSAGRATRRADWPGSSHPVRLRGVARPGGVAVPCVSSVRQRRRSNHPARCSRWPRARQSGCQPARCPTDCRLNSQTRGRRVSWDGISLRCTPTFDCRRVWRTGRNNHMLVALSRRGEDVPGNLVLGDESFARWQALDTVAHTRDDYPGLAEATIAGHPPGSSAGGERPKFSVFVDGRHRLVKFASPLDQRRGPAMVTCSSSRHWRSTWFPRAGLPGSRTHVVELPSHWFLESERFDRVGARGRLAVLSLTVRLHDNPAHSWAQAAVELSNAGRLSDEDARRLRWLDAFGTLIGNTDRHQFNMLVFPAGARFRLAPAFNQVSMLSAPASRPRAIPGACPAEGELRYAGRLGRRARCGAGLLGARQRRRPRVGRPWRHSLRGQRSRASDRPGCVELVIRTAIRASVPGLRSRRPLSCAPRPSRAVRGVSSGMV